MFGFIIISWWVFLIIAGLLILYLILNVFVKGTFDIIASLVEAEKGERIVLIFVYIAITVLWLWWVYG